MRKKIFSIILAMSCAWLSLTGAEPGILRIWDFEDNEAIKGIDCKDNSPDWDNSKSKITLSGEWASQGMKSAKVEFKAVAANGGAWRVISLPLSPKCSDWRGYDTLELEIYNPSTTIYTDGYGSRIHFVGSSKINVKAIEPGVNRLVYELDKCGVTPETGTMSKLALNWLYPVKDITFYVDNVRLVNYDLLKARKLAGKIKLLVQVFPESKSEADALLAEAAALEKAALAANDRTAYLASQAAIKKLKNQLAVLTRRKITEKFKILTDGQKALLVKVLQNLPMEELSSNNFLTENARQSQIEDTAAGTALLNQIIAKEEWKQNLCRIFRDKPFVVGISNYPYAYQEGDLFVGKLEGKVTIEGASREYVPFQLMIIPRQNMKNVKISISNFTGPGTINNSNVEIAPMGWYPDLASGKLWADMLRPDIQVFDVAEQFIQPVWFNVFIPPATPGGDYHAVVTVRAENADAVDIPVKLKVYPFELPVDNPVKTAAHGSFVNPDPEVDAKFMAAHRYSPGQIYSHLPRQLHTISQMKRWREWGLSSFNLMRFNDTGKDSFTVLPDGKLQYSGSLYWAACKVLDPWFAEARKSDPEGKFIRENCFFYTFDEKPPKMAEALDHLAGKIKKRYGNIRIAAAINMPMPTDLKNLDIWMGTPDFWRSVRDKIPAMKADKKEIWWYNLLISYHDPVASRAQFWSTWKDRFDGVLEYNVADRTATLYGSSLFFKPKQTDKKGKKILKEIGLIRRNERNEPLSTVAFEYWREGLQDITYLAMLRDLKDKLAGSSRKDNYRGLIEEATQITDVPDKITAGLLDSRPVQENEITVSFSNVTTNMADITQTKQKAAELIVKIMEALKK